MRQLLVTGLVAFATKWFLFFKYLLYKIYIPRKFLHRGFFHRFSYTLRTIPFWRVLSCWWIIFSEEFSLYGWFSLRIFPTLDDCPLRLLHRLIFTPEKFFPDGWFPQRGITVKIFLNYIFFTFRFRGGARDGKGEAELFQPNTTIP